MDRGYADAITTRRRLLPAGIAKAQPNKGGSQPGSWASGDFGRAIKEYVSDQIQEDSASFHSTWAPRIRQKRLCQSRGGLFARLELDPMC